MALFDVLAVVVDALDQSGIPHMVSGSVASARHGESRATQDIDIVIDPSREQILHFDALLGSAGWYVGDGLEALEHRSQFSVIDPTSGWKVDLVIRRDRPFSIAEFARRRPTVIGGVATSIVTVEDSILSKLEWAKDSRSERQLRDVTSMIAQQRTSIDWDYVRSWADELGVRDLLDEVSRPPS